MVAVKGFSFMLDVALISLVLMLCFSQCDASQNMYRGHCRRMVAETSCDDFDASECVALASELCGDFIDD